MAKYFVASIILLLLHGSKDYIKIKMSKKVLFTLEYPVRCSPGILYEEDKFIRFHWLHMPKGEYFEWSIDKSEVTNQTILVIKDFADKKDIKDQSQLWEYQVKDLFHRIGN